MLEIVCKVLFFLSMLVVYINVTSTSIVLVIVLGYVISVFSYYYFNNIQAAIDEWWNFFNFGDRLTDAMNPPSSDISGYFLNRKYGKINNGSIPPAVGGKKLYGPLADASFAKENNLLEGCTPSMLKADYKNGTPDLPSPIMKSGSPVWSSRPNREKLKINFNAKTDGNGRKNALQLYGPNGTNRRYDTNLDMKSVFDVILYVVALLTSNAIRM